MNFLKALLKRSNLLVFLLFIGLHLALLNINSVEWGDSYRILRAAEFIREFSYPQDEKRPPLFSAVLAVRPSQVDPVIWGKYVMLFISLAAFGVFYKLCVALFNENKRLVTLALLLFALNPVYLYWSLRIYADVPLSLIVLLALYLLTIWRNNLSVLRLLSLGLIAGLAVLTRFEGYLLFISLAAGIKFSSGINLTNIKEKIIKMFWFTLAFLITVSPYLFFNNPLTSTYFEEPGNRTYDLRVLITYLLSLLFVFGFIYAGYFLVLYKKVLSAFVLEHIGISMYVLLVLILVLLWPAAVPRLFVSAIPFLVIYLCLGIDEFFKSKERLNVLQIVLLVVLLVIYFVGQYVFRLQFLVPQTSVFLVILAINLVLGITLVAKSYKLFTLVLVHSLLIWTLSTVYLHKNIYTSLKIGAEYVQQNLSGKVLYNDVSSVSDWYLNQLHSGDNVSGKYADFDNKKFLTHEYLSENGIDYLLISNEHNPNLEISLEKRPYLELITSFNYTHGGREFFTKIVKVSKESV